MGVHHTRLPRSADWKGDDLANMFLTREHCYQTVQAGGDAGVGRRAVLVGFQQVAESFLGLRFIQAHDFKYLSLYLGVGDPDAPAGELESVADQVILLGARLPRSSPLRSFST